jgi:predicted Zn-dependent peptidase
MTYTLTTLDNGLRVASCTLPARATVTVAVSVNVGARYESEAQNGISHLLEHMAFKGTSRRNAKQIAEAFDDIGGNSNAYTSLENTVYYARVLKENLREAVDILADILQNSTFDEAELNRERGVIIQEIAMHQDSPDDLIFDFFHETAYPNQPLGRSILGTETHIKAFTRSQIQDYIGAHYHAPSMVLSAAGNISHAELVELGRHFFGTLESAPPSPAVKAVYHGGEYRKKKTLEQLHVMLGFPSVTMHDDDYYPAQLASTILGGGMSSRLFQEVREKRGLAYSVSAFLTPYEDSGLFGIYAATAEDKGAELIPVLCDEVLRFADSITDTELLRAKTQHKASLLMASESASSVAEWMGRHLMFYNRYKPASELAGIIDAVTKEDILRVASSLCHAPNITFCSLGPQKNLPTYEKIQKHLGH